MLDRSIRSMDAGLSYSFTPFLEKTKLRTARKAVQEHGIGISTFKDTPTSYTHNMVEKAIRCKIQAWVALHRSSINCKIYFPFV